MLHCSPYIPIQCSLIVPANYKPPISLEICRWLCGSSKYHPNIIHFIQLCKTRSTTRPSSARLVKLLASKLRQRFFAKQLIGWTSFRYKWYMYIYNFRYLYIYIFIHTYIYIYIILYCYIVGIQLTSTI